MSNILGMLTKNILRYSGLQQNRCDLLCLRDGTPPQIGVFAKTAFTGISIFFWNVLHLTVALNVARGRHGRTDISRAMLMVIP